MPRGSNFKKPYRPEFRREAVGLYWKGDKPQDKKEAQKPSAYT